MKKSIKTIGLVLGVALAASCSGMLDITPPNSITDEQVQDILGSEAIADEVKHFMNVDDLADFVERICSMYDLENIIE